MFPKNVPKAFPLLFLCLVCTLLLFQGCQKENDFQKLKGSQWQPGLALPLINSSLSVKELVKDGGAVQTDSLDKITLIYGSQLSAPMGKDLISISDLSTQLNASITRLQLLFSMGRIDSVVFAGGTLDYHLLNPDSHDIQVGFQIPALQKGGVPLDISFTVPGSTGQPSYHSGSVDLSGYSMTLSHLTDTLNSFLVNYQANILQTGQDVTGQYPLQLNISSLLFELLKGYFGQFNFNIKRDTIPLPIFKNWTQGSVSFDDPKLHLKISNSFGFPIAAELSSMKGFTGTGNEIPLQTSSTLEDTFMLDYPEGTQGGQYLPTTITLNKNNSNLPNLLSFSPYGISYDFFFTANLEEDSSQTEIMNDTSKFELEWKAELPLYGRIKGVQIRDTFPIGANTLESLSNVNKAKFKLRTLNTLPFQLDLQVYFLNDREEKIDSLLSQDQRIIRSGPIDQNGKVTAPAEKVTLIDYRKARSKNLDQARKLLLKATVNSTHEGNASIQVYGDQRLTIRLSTLLHAQISI